MCRMILAHGRFSSLAVLHAARAMSEGCTATHDGPIKQHLNGWGAVWIGTDGGMHVHRDRRPMTESMLNELPGAQNTSFLAVHVRHATLAHNQGLEFTHPITRSGTEVPWLLLHNGFLPTIYRQLGRERSIFDSSEYFDYIVPAWGDRLDPDKVLAQLAQIEPGGTSANAIVVNPRRAYIIHWTQPGVQLVRYFTMSHAQTEGAVYYASEQILALAPEARWSPLPSSQVIEIDLQHLERGTQPRPKPKD